MKSKPLHLFCLLLIVASTLCSVSILAQVPTRFIDKTDITPIEELIPGTVKDREPAQKVLPVPDIQRAINEHEREGRGRNLFAVRTNTQFSLSDGQFYENKNYPDKINWKLTIKAPGAKSLSFHFSNVNIPEGTELFVYNLNEGMIFGPVTSEVLGATEFISDIVYGDHATIEAIIPIVYVDLFSINIEAVNYGFKDGSNNERAFGQSAPCNNNIQCFSAGYSVHRGAVCVTVVGGTEDCSGTLVNNACDDIRPYILTANHCTAGRNLATMIFRFNWYSPNCTPNQNSGYISFLGSTQRATWTNSDFTLLELNQPILGTPNLSLLGWNRSTTPNDDYITAIHHPRGDVMKISFDNENLATSGNFWLIDQWDDGLVEPGSSGSCLLDLYNRVIGQLHGGDNNIGCPGGSSGGSLVDNNTYGKLSVSWTGGGTNTTRLNNWLGGASSPTTTNTIQVPYLTGNNLLCTSNQTYTLVNPIPGRTTSWSVTPTSLFGSATSGTSTSAVLKGASSSSSGLATLTYTQIKSGCNNVTLQKQFWVGIPPMPTSLTITGVSPYNYIDASLTMPTGAVASSYQWFIDGSLALTTTTPYAYYIPVSSCGTHTLKARAINSCGTGSYAITYPSHTFTIPCFSLPSNESNIASFTIYPNPVDHEMDLTYPDDTPFIVELLDINGKSQILDKKFQSKEKYQLTDLVPGVYLVRLTSLDGKLLFTKTIIRS